jgi:hypothetical protein
MPLAPILHAAAVLLATWSAATPAVPPASRQAAVQDFALSDARQSAAGLATYGGVVAWWGTADDVRDVRLTVWEPGGRPRRLPVRANADPYRRALDVGRGPDGAVWITYARCAKGRCRPRGYDLRTGADRDLGVGGGVAASVWGARVAVVRQTGADTPSSLWLGAIGQGVARRVPLRGDPLGAPAALDLRDDRVALLAWEPGDDVRSLYLLAGRVSDPTTIRPVAGGGAGEECTGLVASPTWTASALTWMTSSLGPASTCGRHRRALYRRDDRGHATTVAPIPRAAPKQAVVAGGRVVGLFVAQPDGGQGDRDACDPQALLVGEGHGCRLRVTPAPRWGPASSDG